MKHVLIINPNRDSFSNPTLVTVINKLLVSNEIQITLLAPIQSIGIPEAFSSVSFLELPEKSINWTKKVHTWIAKLFFYIRLKKIVKKKNIQHVIAIDPIGLIHAGRLNRMYQKIKIHYFSFELFFEDEVKNKVYYRKIKKKETFYSKKIDSILIQDEIRKTLLLDENKIGGKNIPVFLIPVSPNCDKIQGENKLEWRQKLNIHEHQTVLLHSGSFDSWSGADLLLNLMEKKIPQDVVFVIHLKEKLDFQNKKHVKLKELADSNPHIILHTHIFSSYEQYLTFLQIADFGFSLYVPDFKSPYTGKNIAEIGLASGKFACFISQGVPVIATNSSFFQKYVSVYSLGLLFNPEMFYELCNEFKKNHHTIEVQDHLKKFNSAFLITENELTNFCNLIC